MEKKLARVLAKIGPLDREAMKAAQLRQDSLTKPQGSLGKLEELSVHVAGIRGWPLSPLGHKLIVTMAADHGVTAQGVSLYPQEVTAQMVFNFLKGGAGINVLARQVGARVVVVDMGVAADLGPQPGLVSHRIAPGTRDMTVEPAMSRGQALEALMAGIDMVEGEKGKGLDIVGTGDMGIGNTTSSSAILAALGGVPVEEATGRGTGVDGRQLSHKMEVIRRALVERRPDPSDAVDVLAKVGGFEIGGLAGVILAAGANRVPVVIDGFISGAAALVACGLCPQVRDYIIASHVSAEAGHRLLLERLGLLPLFDLKMRLGEGTGAVLGMFIVEAAVRIINEMATFGEAGVSEAEGKENSKH